MSLCRQKEIQVNVKISIKGLLINSKQNSKIAAEINRFVNRSTFSLLMGESFIVNC